MTRPVADEHITGISPYVPGKQVAEIEREYGVEGAIKMASNENPLGPSPAAREVIKEASAEAHIYPDGDARELKHAVAEHHDVPVEEVLCGNGSDQLLRLAVQALSRWGQDAGLISNFSFGAYPIALRGHNLDVRRVDMKPGLQYDMPAMAEAVSPNTRIVFLANPNNPTGTYITEGDLRGFLRSVPDDVVVIVDEAYTQYVEADDYASAMEMRDEHELLIVTRTFSKCFGLAAMRIGYAISTPEVIDAINRVRAPFNCNRIGQKAAVAALADREFVQRSVEVNEQGREQLESGLAELRGRGVDWIPSQTNFLLCEMPFAGREVYEAMLYEGVITRPVEAYGLPNHLRISIGTEEQNKACLNALEAALTTLEEGA
jgi:histidinol-phosphate aminotransferase